LPALRLDYSTLVPNEAWLSAGLASGVEEPAEPWTTITRPAGVGRALTLTAKSTLAPAASDAAVQVKVAERTLPDLLQCQPGGAATDAVAVIVLPAITSTGCAAATLPLLARVNAYCALNAVRGSVAGPSIDSARSACGGASTSSAACALSLAATGSGVCDCTAVARPSAAPACPAAGGAGLRRGGGHRQRERLGRARGERVDGAGHRGGGRGVRRAASPAGGRRDRRIHRLVEHERHRRERRRVRARVADVGREGRRLAR